ncbi:MAG: ClpXP protease specificity-enhancing factor, partial [Lysobacterales bacterium 13-68-4]
PVSAVLALYAQENGQGMMFPADDSDVEPPPSPPDGGESASAPEPSSDDDKPKRGSHLRIVK